MRKIFLMLIVFSSLTKANDVVPLKLGVFHSKCKPDLVPLLLAREQKLFEAAGIDLTVNYFEADEGKETSRDSAKKLFSQSDLIVAGRARIYSVESNEPGAVKILAANILDENHSDYAILVKKDSNINSIQDLSGKTISLEPNSGRAKFVLMRMVLEKLNVDTKKVKLQRGKLSNLASGKSDAIYLREPELSQALQLGLYKSILDNPIVKYVQSPWPMGFLATSEVQLKTKSGAIKKFNEVWTQAIVRAKKNPEEAKQVLKKCMISEYKLDGDFKLVNHWSFSELNGDAIQKQMNLYFEKKIIRNPVTFKSVVDFKFD